MPALLPSPELGVHWAQVSERGKVLALLELTIKQQNRVWHGVHCCYYSYYLLRFFL